MPEIRSQSREDDRCSVHFGDHVAIYDLSRGDAEEIVATYLRHFDPSDGPVSPRELHGPRASRASRSANRMNRAA